MLDLVMVVVVAAAGANLLWWRFGMLGAIGPAGVALFVLEVVTVMWLVATALLFTGRTGPEDVAPPPEPVTTLDILVPVAGEPVDLVEATIRAAQAVEWPAQVIVCNDGFIAGKENWREIERLCRRLGVRCLTRTTGAKGKAGNLNHALAYTTADAILTIDADHLVVPDVAQQLLGWLGHEAVAFVATPQAFYGSHHDALNSTEPVFYRATQPARDRHGLAFSTGNGVVYRREALVRIGGFSEWSLVEDLHTSIRLHAAGWTSVFHHRPVTIGLAPRTAAEFSRQRLRWAIDSMRILRHDPPWRHDGLSRRAKLHYSHTLLSYLMSMLQLGFVLGPPAWILGRQSLLAGGDWEAQAIHIGPWLAACLLLLVHWAGPVGAVRSVRVGAALLPVVFWAAAWRTLSPQVHRGTVTVKAGLPRFNGLVLAGLAVPFGLVATMVWGVLDPRDGGSDLAMGWAGFLTFLAIGPLLRLGHGRLWPAVSQTVIALAVGAMVSGAVATSRFGWDPPFGLYPGFGPDLAAQGAAIEHNELGTTVVVGPPVRPDDRDVAAGDARQRLALAPADGIYLGFTSDDLPYDLDAVDRWADEVTEPQIVHWYQQWGSGDSRFREDWLVDVADSGRIPMISWEAWAKPEQGYRLPEQTLGDMRAVADGDHDDYIDGWAAAAADYGQPILLRPFHEMNGFWYPWSIGVNGNTAEDYIAGWRHVVDRFRAAGADNVSFVWSINTLANFEEGRGVEAAYPGDDYVDWVATSGFNWDDYDPEWSSWVSPRWVFSETYDVLASFGKPVMFAEVGTGTSTGDGAGWVADAMDWFTTLPELGAVVWFDRTYDGGIDFRLDAGQRSALSAAVAADDRFGPAPVLVGTTPMSVDYDRRAAEAVGILETIEAVPAVSPDDQRLPIVREAGRLEPRERVVTGAPAWQLPARSEVEAVDGAGVVADEQLVADDDRG